MKKLIIAVLVITLALSACEAVPEREGKYYFSENEQQSEQYEVWSNQNIEDFTLSLTETTTFKSEEDIGEFIKFVQASDEDAKKLRTYVEHLIHYFYDYGRDNFIEDMEESKDLVSPDLLNVLLNCDVIQERKKQIDGNNASISISMPPTIMCGNCVKQFEGPDGHKIYRVATSIYIDAFADDEFYESNPHFVPGSTWYEVYFYIDASDLDNLVLLQMEEFIRVDGGGIITVSYTPQGVTEKIRLKDETAECTLYSPERAGSEIMQADYIGKYCFHNDTGWEIYAYVYTFLETVYNLGDGSQENYEQNVQEYMSEECIANEAYNQGYLQYRSDIISENACLNIKINPAFMDPRFFPHRNDNSVYEYSKDGKTIYAVKATFCGELRDDSESVEFSSLTVSSVGTWEYDAWVFFSVNDSDISIEAFRAGLNINGGSFEYDLESVKADEELYELGYELGDITKKN